MTTSERATHFDEWYASMSISDRYDAISNELLGLPPDLESSGLLSWDGIGAVADAIGVGAGDVLVDLACGRGGYGLEVASRTGAALIGVDFSVVAIERARSKNVEGADFRVGDMRATGLPDHVANAVMCVDAMQFAEPYERGIAECRRILAPGGRLVITGWEPASSDDGDALPERLRRDIGRALRDGGFSNVNVVNMPDWRDLERRRWQRAVSLEPNSDASIESFRREGERVMSWIDRSRRVLATAKAPA